MSLVDKESRDLDLWFMFLLCFLRQEIVAEFQAESKTWGIAQSIQARATGEPEYGAEWSLR
jgi:hypothetical protein